MKVVFRCRTTSEVLMMADSAKWVLNTVGLVIERGYLKGERLRAALRMLELAVAKENCKSAGEKGQDSDDGNQETKSVSLAQRAYPLVAMMRIASQEDEAVHWGELTEADLDLLSRQTANGSV